MREYFQMLFGDLEGFVPIVTFPKSARNSKAEWKDWPLNEYQWFAWPRQVDEMIEYCEARKKEDVYTTVGVCSTTNNKKGSIPMLNVVHCDADGARPEYFAVPPTVTVQSSPDRFQLYWKLDKPTKASKVEPLAKRVSYSQREHGADFGWNLNKLLRVPGTTNTKPAYRKPRVRLRVDGPTYTVKELRKAFSGVDEAIVSTASIPMPDKLPKLNELLARLPSNTDIWEMYAQPAKPTAWNPDGSRFRVLYKLSCHLFRMKFTREEVFVLCENSANNKYAQDGRNEAELWRDVLKAEEDVNLHSRGVVFVETDVEGEVVEQFVPVTEACVLLTDKERKSIQPNAFIENYVKWAEKKTPMADVRYHRANAITILSTVFSEHGMARPQFGPLPLNIWFMVLGVTSRSGKSTAASLMLRMLAAIGHDREDDYELASDSTPEALNVSLAKRGDISSLYHVDEAQALIGDSKGGKGYMAGLITLLTKLYDGKVPARDRTMGEKTKSTPTSFTMNLLGVPGKMAESLDRDDFASGFLARFVFVIGTPKPQTRESAFLKQSEQSKKGDDPDFHRLVGMIVRSRQYWERRHGPDGEKAPIYVNEDAWARWNEMKYVLENEIAPATADPEAILPTAQRMAISVYKLACLFAMVDMSKTVEMNHMLNAMAHGEKWFDTSTLMASMVHESQWARMVSELVEHLQNHGRMSFGQLYRERFGNLKPREFTDVVEAAEMTGRVKVTVEITKNGNVRYLETT